MLDDDRTARARIRDAAIAVFAARGYAGASAKAIADVAGVSPALVFHHFGSKAGLRAACDAHVLAVLEEQKRAALRAGPQVDVLAVLRQGVTELPLMDYLARMLTDGSSQVDALVDGLVDLTVAALETGVESGVLRPVEQPRELSVVLVLWSLGLLVLRDHAERLLGVDITGGAEQRARYVAPAMEALRGLYTDEAYERGRRTLAVGKEDARDG